MIPCVRFKDGVQFDPLTPTLARLLCALDMTARMMGVELTVTCGREGHPEHDPHTRGAALDVRASNLTMDLTLRCYQYLRSDSVLGPRFTVLYEVPATPVNGALKNIATVNPHATAPHFHLQTVMGSIYPPQDAPKDTE